MSNPEKAPQDSDNCASCRWHSKQNRLNPIIEAGFSDLVEAEDEPIVVYMCNLEYPAKEIGSTPKTKEECSTWAAPTSNNKDALDQIEKKMSNRTKTCGKCGSKIYKPGPCPVCEDNPYGTR